MSGIGEVEIELDGEIFVLRSTVDAFKSVPEQFDGFVGAFRKLAAVDINAAAHLIAIGTGKGRNAKERERITEKLFAAGLEDALPMLTEWLSLLSAGGRMREEAASPGK